MVYSRPFLRDNTSMDPKLHIYAYADRNRLVKECLILLRKKGLRGETPSMIEQIAKMAGVYPENRDKPLTLSWLDRVIKEGNTATWLAQACLQILINQSYVPQDNKMWYLYVWLWDLTAGPFDEVSSAIESMPEYLKTNHSNILKDYYAYYFDIRDSGFKK